MAKKKKPYYKLSNDINDFKHGDVTEKIIATLKLAGKGAHNAGKYLVEEIKTDVKRRKEEIVKNRSET